MFRYKKAKTGRNLAKKFKKIPISFGNINP